VPEVVQPQALDARGRARPAPEVPRPSTLGPLSGGPFG
jgi:hypothetical protein